MSTVKKESVTLTDRFGHFLFSFSSSIGREGKDRVQKQKIHLQVFYFDYLYICVGSFLYFSFVHTLSLYVCVCALLYTVLISRRGAIELVSNANFNAAMTAEST